MTTTTDNPTLSWRLGAYENALVWIQSSEYEKLNNRYKDEMGTLYGSGWNLGLCYFLSNHYAPTVYFELDQIFPELVNYRFTSPACAYLAETTEQRIEILFKAIDEVKQKIKKR